MQTVVQYLAQQGYKYEEDWNTPEVLLKMANTKNRDTITFRGECGHRKTCQVATLVRGDPKCTDCKLLEQYGYDRETKTLTCKVCGGVSHNVPRVNLSIFRCLHCPEEDTVESRFYRDISQRAEASPGWNEELQAWNEEFTISRHAQYSWTGGGKKYVANFSCQSDEHRLFIEIDENSHLRERSASNHRQKNFMAVKSNLPLLRIHTPSLITSGAIVEDLLCRFFTEEGYEWMEKDVQHPFLLVADEGARQYFSSSRLEYDIPDNALCPFICQDGVVLYGKTNPELKDVQLAHSRSETDGYIEESITFKRDDYWIVKRDFIDVRVGSVGVEYPGYSITHIGDARAAPPMDWVMCEAVFQLRVSPETKQVEARLNVVPLAIRRE